MLVVLTFFLPFLLYVTTMILTADESYFGLLKYYETNVF